jgi:hypothetical protein
MKATATKTATANVKDSTTSAPVRKSRFTEFWEKYPNGILTIVDMKAVMK